MTSPQSEPRSSLPESLRDLYQRLITAPLREHEQRRLHSARLPLGTEDFYERVSFATLDLAVLVTLRELVQLLDREVTNHEVIVNLARPSTSGPREADVQLMLSRLQRAGLLERRIVPAEEAEGAARIYHRLLPPGEKALERMREDLDILAAQL